MSTTDPYAKMIEVAYGPLIRALEADHERRMQNDPAYREAVEQAKAEIEQARWEGVDPYVGADDPEEQRRASTVASDGGQCMIYRRPA